jgi:two-component system, NtrC family, nitrogen regulation sensor histidine kinase NtrY
MLKRVDVTIPQRLRGISGWAALTLVVLGTLTGLVTFLLLTGVAPIKPSETIINALIIANTVLVALMGAMIAGQLIHLFIEHRKGTPGTGLHIRLVSLFSMVALLPAILVAVFAAVTLNRGLDAWFSERTRAIVETAASVADAYVLNASEATRTDVANIAADLVVQLPDFNNDRPTYLRRCQRLAAVRNLAALYVFNSQSKIIEANITASEKITFIAPGLEDMAAADKGDVVLLAPGRGGNLVRALMKLQGYPSEYVYVYRILSPVVIEQLTKTQDAKAEYDRLLKQRIGVQLTFALVYALVSLVFLLASIWAGLWFSDRLVAPLVRLLQAARNVAQGDFNAKVKVIDGPGDLITLTRTFNMMTDQVKQHQNQLVETNNQLDDRRRFTEAMLAGVSAGVIGIDEAHKISLVNRSALTLLGRSEAHLLGLPIEQVLPEMAALYEAALTKPTGSAEGQVDMQVAGQDLSFVVRITTERSDNIEHGYVLTFDDITQLVSAQRNSAWSDIARRIAHEIKNPLTPIQLSAERLKRKYLKEIKTDRDVFEQCTDTIIRQVGDLGRIVDEFSSFARMPKAVPELNVLSTIIQEATVLQRVSSSDIDIVARELEPNLKFPFDRRLITQAITNLVKNAKEAIEAREKPKNKGIILIETGLDLSAPFIRVTDNGIGLPQENRKRLAEPYMTTREKGTGLGLAIVKRIMEEHGGRLKLEDAASGQGASITLIFAPLTETQSIESTV